MTLPSGEVALDVGPLTFAEAVWATPVVAGLDPAIELELEHDTATRATTTPMTRMAGQELAPRPGLASIFTPPGV